jgi:transposase
VENLLAKTWTSWVAEKNILTAMLECGAYKSLAEKICPNAAITVDRFHVMKLVNEELNRARIKKLLL